MDFDPNIARRYEAIAKQEFEKLGYIIDISSEEEDRDGIDLKGMIDGRTLGVYARARFGGYTDITFNAEQALDKLIINCKRFDEFFGVLHYATEDLYASTSSITHTFFINLKKWVSRHNYNRDLLQMTLIKTYKKSAENDPQLLFIMPADIWKAYVIKEITYPIPGEPAPILQCY